MLGNQLHNQHIIQIVSLLSFVSFLLIALFKNSFSIIDSNANSWVISIQTNSFTNIAVVIADVFDTSALLVITLITSTYLFYKKNRKNSALLLIIMA